MVEVKKGDVFVDIKRGVHSKGKWFMAFAKSENGKEQITIFGSNPDDIPEDAYAVAVKEIEKVTKTATKSKDGTKWYQNYNITAVLESVEGGAKPIEDDESEFDSPF